MNEEKNENKQNKINNSGIITPSIGLNLDSLPESLQQNEYSFALNSILNNEEGYNNVLSNENSNDVYYNIKQDFIILGSCYINDNETMLFLVKKDNSESEIGILTSFEKGITSNLKYEELFNDRDQIKKEKLNFRISHTIQAVFREKVNGKKIVYFTDDLNPPMFIDVNKIKHKKSCSLPIYLNDFLVQKVIENIPEYQSITINDTGGFLPPSSVSVFIQLLDDNFYESDFLSESGPYIIYHEKQKSDFHKISGTINITDKKVNDKTDTLSYGLTSKSITVKIGDVDDYFSFYKLGFAIADNIQGEYSKFYVTDVLSTKNKVFTFTGKNYFEEVSRDKIAIFNKNNKIERVKTLCIHNNRLIYGNIKNKVLDFKHLQKYASRIKTDCVLKEVNINDVNDKANIKSPYNKVEGFGFQPGEIYSLGIVYVFEGNIESPVFHIPGKGHQEHSSTIYDSKEGLLPMRGDGENISDNLTYLSRSKCKDFDFWGLDYYGNPLLDTHMRFHKFPTRKQANLPLYEIDQEKSIKTYYGYYVTLFTKGNNQDHKNRVVEIKPLVPDENSIESKVTLSLNTRERIEELKNVVLSEVLYVGEYTIVKNEDGDVVETKDIKTDLNVLSLPVENGQVVIRDGLTLQKEEKSIGDKTFKVIERVTSERIVNNIETHNFDKELDIEFNELVIRFFRVKESTDGMYYYKSKVFGLHFSNIELPDDLNGKKCIGYYIVAQDRTDQDKTILDSAYVLPNMKTDKFIAHGLFNPKTNGRKTRGYFGDYASGDKYLSRNSFSLVSPRILFEKLELNNLTKIEEIDVYEPAGDYTDPNISAIHIQAVDDKQSHNPKDVSEHFNDEDGSSVKNCILYTEIKQVKRNPDVNPDDIPFNFNVDDNTDIVLLGPFKSKEAKTRGVKVYNLSSTNHIAVVDFDSKGNKNLNISKLTDGDRFVRYPYVYLKNEHKNFYSDRRSPYYKVTQKIQKGNTCETFNGDYYITALRHHSVTMLPPETAYKCVKDPGIWKMIVGSILFIGSFFVPGSTLALGLLLTGFFTYALGAVDLVESQDINIIFSKQWKKGLKNVILDNYILNFFFKDIFYQDDTHRSVSQVIGDMIFETSINTSLRIEPKSNLKVFLNPFTPHMTDNKNKFSALSKESSTKTCAGSDKTYYYEDNDLYGSAESNEETFFLNLLVTEDKDFSRNVQGKKGTDYGYRNNGVPVPNMFLFNPDFGKVKSIFTHYEYPIEYDFYNNEVELFKNRFHWSEQSNHEEQRDNMLVFKPNNYKDINPTKGDIMNVFDFNRNLFIHTEETLIKQTTAQQEKIYDDTVAYIGTGEFGSLPEESLFFHIDGGGGGIISRDHHLLTELGYFFVSYKDKKVYHFLERVEEISLFGLRKWFRENLVLRMQEDIFSKNKKNYFYLGNTSVDYGIGYIFNFDPLRKRLLLTKKDYLNSTDNIENNDFDFCINKQGLKVFYDIENNRNILNSNDSNQRTQLINNSKLFNKNGERITYEALDELSFEFVDIIDCELVFKTYIKKKIIQENNVEGYINNNTKLFFVYDNSGSMNASQIEFIKKGFDNLLERIKNELGVEIPKENILSYNADSTQEPYYKYMYEVRRQSPPNKEDNLIVVSLINEADDWVDLLNYNFIKQYQEDFLNHYKSIKIIHTVISTSDKFYGSFTENNKLNISAGRDNVAYLYKKIIDTITNNYSEDKRNKYIEDKLGKPSLRISIDKWNGIKEYVKENRISFDDLDTSNMNMDIITDLSVYINDSEEMKNKFTERVSEAIFNSIITDKTYRKEELEVDYLEEAFLHISSEIVNTENFVANDWTLSYSLENKRWISFHSYTPNKYFRNNNNLYSWINKDNSIYLHDIKNKYCNYYGVEYPFIVEIISQNNNNSETSFSTKSFIYDKDLDSYVESKKDTFNKAILYNDRQCSGILTLINKEDYLNMEDYLKAQILNENSNICLYEREGDLFYINDYRDIRIDYNNSIWIKDRNKLNTNGYIDKELNEATLDLNKDWFDLEDFNHIHLVKRFIKERNNNKLIIKIVQ